MFLKRFGQVAVYEGISYLVLLFIAMPLKYWADYPLAVRWVGSVHGALFVIYILLLLMCWKKHEWSFKRVCLFSLASIIPFATFWVDRKIRPSSPKASD